MSLIHLEKQGDVWRSRVEGHFILGAHPIETVRKGLPEAMAQAVVDHCAMSGGDVAVFAQRLMAEIDALAPVNVFGPGAFEGQEAGRVPAVGDKMVVWPAIEVTTDGAVVSAAPAEPPAATIDDLVPLGDGFIKAVNPQVWRDLTEEPAPPTEPRRARVPRKAAVIAPEAEPAPGASGGL